MVTITNAITIDAPPHRVWPWLAQLGAGRGGWYSYDRIDNGGRPSARSILPEFQQIATGDIFPAVPGATDAFVVFAVDPPRHLILTVPDPLGAQRVSWEYLLESDAGGRTRLLVRGRVSRNWLADARDRDKRFFIEQVYAFLAGLPRPLLLCVARVGHRVMLARHLRGIKLRAEGT